MAAPSDAARRLAVASLKMEKSMEAGLQALETSKAKDAAAKRQLLEPFMEEQRQALESLSGDGIGSLGEFLHAMNQGKEANSQIVSSAAARLRKQEAKWRETVTSLESQAPPSDAQRRLAVAALRMEKSMDAGLLAVKNCSDDEHPSAKLKLLEPFVKEQRQALETLKCDGIKAEGDFRKAMFNSGDAKVPIVASAATRLQSTQAKWREMYSNLERAVNAERMPDGLVLPSAPANPPVSFGGSTPSDLERHLAVAALRVEKAVDAAMAEIQLNPKSDPVSKAKLLEPLVEEHRLALQPLQGDKIACWADFQSALGRAQESNSQIVSSAATRLRIVETRWREMLASLESQADSKATAPLKVGATAPDFQLMSAAGEQVSLKSILAKKPTGILLVWLRHFGCLKSRDHVAELAKQAETLKKLKITVVVLSFCADAKTAKRWNDEVGSPFLHLIDPAAPGVNGAAGATYHSWGFRESLAGAWSPEAIRFLSDQKLSGRKAEMSLGQDVQQMGGDLFLDGKGSVVLDHYSQTNTDRPVVGKTLISIARWLDSQRGSGAMQVSAGTAVSNLAAVAIAVLVAFFSKKFGKSVGTFLATALPENPGLCAALGAAVALALLQAKSMAQGLLKDQ